MSFEKYLQQCF